MLSLLPMRETIDWQQQFTRKNIINFGPSQRRPMSVGVRVNIQLGICQNQIKHDAHTHTAADFCRDMLSEILYVFSPKRLTNKKDEKNEKAQYVNALKRTS